MDQLLYVVARALVALVQRLPLLWVARLGRAAGGLAYLLDARHRHVALHNLSMCLGKDMPAEQIREIARENFRRIGESFACAIKTASMSYEELKDHVEFVAPAQFLPGSTSKRLVVAIGHFGNFELYARFGQFSPGYKCATTYRALRQPSLTRLLQSMRERSGCSFFERRFEGHALRLFMKGSRVVLGLLADQHAGDAGLRLPFLGQDCSTSAAPAVFALRYDCALYTAACYRVDMARWRFEAGPEIALHENGVSRSTAAIMLDVNQAFEAAVRRDPANWFWVHKRWKPPPAGRLRSVTRSQIAPTT